MAAKEEEAECLTTLGLESDIIQKVPGNPL